MRPGQDVKCFLEIARRSVDFAGPKQDPERYSANSTLDCRCRMMPLATCCFGFDVGVVLVSLFDRGMSHNPWQFRLPSMITLLFFIIFKLYFEKRAMHSSSQSCPIDINEPVLSSSMMNACWAVGVRFLDS